MNDSFENATPVEDVDFKKARRKTPAPSLPEELKQPPNSPTSERGLISSILLDAERVFDYCDSAGVDANWFYDIRHRELFELLDGDRKANRPINSGRLMERLKDRLHHFGVINLMKIIEASPSVETALYDIGKLSDCYQMRRMIETSETYRRTATAWTDQSDSTESTLSSWEQDALNVRLVSKHATSFSGKDLGIMFVDDCQERHKLGGKLPGISYGLTDLDYLTGGMAPKELIVIGARPSIGKTALALNIAQHCGITGQEPLETVFITLESPASSLVRRLGASISGVSLTAIKTGQFQERDFTKMTSTAVRIKNSKLVIEDHVSKGITTSQLCSLIRRHARKGVKVFMVDFIQLIRPDAALEKKTYEVGESAKRLSAVAKEMDVSIIVNSQLNRDGEGDDNTPPRLKHLAESASIEQAADTIILIHRNRMEKVGKALLLIVKQREGETGVVNTTYLGQFCRFENASRIEE